MPQLNFDHPVAELTEQEDSQTLLAIEVGIAQLEAGQGSHWKSSVKNSRNGVQGNRFPSQQIRGMRSVLHTPIRIYYRVDEIRECVEVIHVWHTARKQPKF
jgi:hypothetical protein